MRDRWHPHGGSYTYGRKLEAGMVIAIDHPGYRHKPWRLARVSQREGGTALIFRPDDPAQDFATNDQSATLRDHGGVYVMDDHYAVCAKCGELPPCAEVWTERISTAYSEVAARYEVEGVCPACQTPVSARQKGIRFEQNLYVPLGPPVVFHGRSRCVGRAIDYDRKIATANGTEPTLSCDGMQTRHLDGEIACSNITCPGNVWHGSFAMCYVLSERCNRPECWALSPTRSPL